MCRRIVYYASCTLGEEHIVSYLPLSHVATQLLDLYTVMAAAGTCWFAQPDALKGSLLQTMKEVHPTVFLGVPRCVYVCICCLATKTLKNWWMCQWVKGLFGGMQLMYLSQYMLKTCTSTAIYVSPVSFYCYITCLTSIILLLYYMSHQYHSTAILHVSPVSFCCYITCLTSIILLLYYMSHQYHSTAIYVSPVSFYCYITCLASIILLLYYMSHQYHSTAILHVSPVSFYCYITCLTSIILLRHISPGYGRRYLRACRWWPGIRQG